MRPTDCEVITPAGWGLGIPLVREFSTQGDVCPRTHDVARCGSISRLTSALFVADAVEHPERVKVIDSVSVRNDAKGADPVRTQSLCGLLAVS